MEGGALRKTPPAKRSGSAVTFQGLVARLRSSNKTAQLEQIRFVDPERASGSRELNDLESALSYRRVNDFPTDSKERRGFFDREDFLFLN